MNKFCPFCGERVRVIRNNSRKMLICRNYPNCRSYTSDIRGPMADDRLRELRDQCHKEFDKLWNSGDMSRSAAYYWMARAMGVSINKAHISRFREKDCLKLLEKLNQRK